MLQLIMACLATTTAVGVSIYGYFTDPERPIWELWLRQIFGLIALAYVAVISTSGYTIVAGYARKRMKNSVDVFEVKVHPKNIFHKNEEIEFLVTFKGKLLNGYIDAKFEHVLGQSFFPMQPREKEGGLKGDQDFQNEKLGCLILPQMPTGEYVVEIGVYDTSKYLYKLLPKEPIQKIVEEITIV